MSVLGLASAVSGFVKVRHLDDKAEIDGTIFKFHYRVTAGILFLCCALVTANNLIGDPINCLTGKSGDSQTIPVNVLNTFCWINSTYTLSSTIAVNRNGKKDPYYHPGIGPEDERFTKVFHAYYQWVPFMLFLQGILFYVTHWGWKNYEEGRIKTITTGLRGPCISEIAAAGTEKNEKRGHLADFLIESLNFHTVFGYTYFFVELLNFFNVLLNAYIIDKFLGGVFKKYGLDVLNFLSEEQDTRTDPMIEIFPRVTKCTFTKYGPSGSIENHDTICVLALNVLNEKIYIFLWFWLIILGILSFGAVAFNLVTLFSGEARKRILLFRVNSERYNISQNIRNFVRRMEYGDFVFLYMISKNLNTTTYAKLLENLIERSPISNYKLDERYYDRKEKLETIKEIAC